MAVKIYSFSKAGRGGSWKQHQNHMAPIQTRKLEDYNDLYTDLNNYNDGEEEPVANEH